MSDLYKIGIHLAVAGNANAFFSTLAGHVLGVHRHMGVLHSDIARVEGGIARLNRMKLAIGGGVSVMAGVGILKAAGHLESAGEKLVHAQTVLGAGLPAATRGAQVLDATAAAWKEAGKNMNTTVTENVAAIHDLYNVVQDLDHAKHLLPAFNTLQVTLSSVKDGAHVGEAASAKSLASAARAFELYGQTDEHALAEAAKGFTKAAIATRGRVNGENLLTTVQGLGDARYGFDKAMKEQGIPALTAIVGPRVGNMLNMMRSNLYGGVVSSETQAKGQIKYGIHKEEDAIFSKGKFKGFKVGSMWKADLYNDNPIEWANAYRQELKRRGVDIEDTKSMQNVIGELARGNKTVRVGLDELLLPGTNKQINKEVANIRNVSDDAAGILSKDDPKLQRDALHKQWENFTTALGAPLVKPAMEALRSLTEIVRDLSQAAAKNPEGAKMLAEGIVALGAAFTAGGAAALLAAIGPVGWLTAGIVALGAAAEIAKPGYFAGLARDWGEWVSAIGKGDLKGALLGSLKGINDIFVGIPLEMVKVTKDIALAVASLMTPIKDWPTSVANEVATWPGRLTDAIAAMGTAIVNKIKEALNPLNWFGSGGATKKDMSFSGSGFDGATIHNASYTPDGVANDNLVGAGAAGVRAGGGSGAVASIGAVGGTGSVGGDYSGGRAIRSNLGGGRVTGANEDPLANARESWDFWKSKGLSDAAAAGLLGMEQGENQFRANSGQFGGYGDRGAAYGTFMHRAPRRKQILEGAGIQIIGAPHSKQLEAAYWEMTKGPDRQAREAWRRLQQQNHTPGSAAGIGVDLFERPLNRVLNKRVRGGYANHWYRQFGGSKAAQPLPPPTPTLPPPPRRQENRPIMVDLHMDRQKVGRAVAMQIADDHRFPKKAGGMDTHGSMRSPGTPVTDAA